ncbi:hypothetical protein ACFLUY_00865 [Chloroflexota bacterium]
MKKQQFCCEAAAARATRQLTLSEGFQVGIINLDTILREVTELNLRDTEALRRELLERVKVYNYVASGAEYDYSTALLRAFQQQFEKSK